MKNITKYISTIFILLCIQVSGLAQTVGVITHVAGSYDEGYVLFAPVNNCDTTYLIDKCGNKVHSWFTTYAPGLDVYLLPDGTLLRSGHVANHVFDPSGGSAGGIIQRFDWNSNLIWQYRISDNLETQNHDICYMPNGHILAAVWEVITDSVAIAAGRDPNLLDTALWSAKIVELEPIGTDSAIIVWQWRLWDHLIQDFDSTKSNYGVIAQHPELLNINYLNTPTFANKNTDWTHLNAVTYNPNLDQVMFSFHNLDEIYIVDHSTSAGQAATHSGSNHGKGGDFLYRYGNASAYNRGSVNDVKLFQQHDPEWIYEGKYANDIIIFNNGNGRPYNYYSSADIIAPPIDSNGNYIINNSAAFGPDTLVNSYGPSGGSSFYSAFMGGAQILPNGNVLVCNAINGEFIELDSVQNRVWDYLNPVCNGIPITQNSPTAKNSVYRCTYYPYSYSGFNGKNFISNPIPIELDPTNLNCVLNTNSIPKIVEPNAIALFPNPADQILLIKMEGLEHIFVSDLSGKVLMSEDIHENAYNINTKMLPPGLYILTINKNIHKQFMVLH